MKKLTYIIIIVLVSVSCTTLKNGYSEAYRVKTLQKAVVITYCKKWKYESESIPSGLVFKFDEFEDTYSVGDTLKIDRKLSESLFISR